MLAYFHFIHIIFEFLRASYTVITLAYLCAGLLNLRDATTRYDSVMTRSNRVKLYLSSWSLSENPLNNLSSFSILVKLKVENINHQRLVAF